MKGQHYSAEFPVYISWHFPRSARHKSTKRDSGGFLVFLRERLNLHVTVSHTNEYVVWLTFNNTDATNTHIGFVYIPPNYSKVHIDRDPFEDLQREIETKWATGRVILAGDFNARTAELRDIDKNIKIDNHTPGILLNDNRENDDKLINTYGRKLIDLCKSNSMIILNGRTRCKRGCNDKGYTCYRYNGSSLVDYTIAELDIIGQITQFEIGEKWHESDNCPIDFKSIPQASISRKPTVTQRGKYISWHPMQYSRHKEQLRHNFR